MFKRHRHRHARTDRIVGRGKRNPRAELLDTLDLARIVLWSVYLVQDAGEIQRANGSTLRTLHGSILLDRSAIFMSGPSRRSRPLVG